MATPKPCLVPPELRFGVNERVSAEGEILISPGAQDLAELSEKVRLSGAESIAISLLFSFANPEDEKQVAAALRQRLCVSDTVVEQTPLTSSPMEADNPEVRARNLSEESVRRT